MDLAKFNATPIGFELSYVSITILSCILSMKSFWRSPSLDRDGTREGSHPAARSILACYTNRHAQKAQGLGLALLRYRSSATLHV